MISEKHSNAARENLKKAIAMRVKKSWVKCVCEYCGKICDVRMASIRKNWRFCSWECRIKGMRGDKGANYGGGKWMYGENNINYKHGKSSEIYERDVALVNQWRRLVFARDLYICQRCGFDKGNVLQAHHMHKWSDYPELRFDISNGITLCEDCHRWVHSNKNVNEDYLCK